MSDVPWSWPDVARELRPLIERLTPDDALMIIRALFAEPMSREEYVAARLSGMIQGTLARREDEAKRSSL